MAELRIPGGPVGEFFAKPLRKLIPVMETEAIRGSATVAYEHIMSHQRVKTGTLLASTNVAVGEAEGRDLPYDDGHIPLPVGIVDQALEARRLGEPLVIAEDAGAHEGKPYGGFVEARYGTFSEAGDAVRAALPGILARAAVKAAREAFR